MWRHGTATGVAVIFSLLFYSTPVLCCNDNTIFGPKRYERQSGGPTIYTDRFTGCASGEKAALTVKNGNSPETRVRSGRIDVNGNKVADERDFRINNSAFEKHISIKQHNELKVILKGGWHGFRESLAAYLRKKHELEKGKIRLQHLREELESLGSRLDCAEVAFLAWEFQKIKGICGEIGEALQKILASLNHNPGIDENEDNENEDLDGTWLKDHRAILDNMQREAKRVYHDYRTLQDENERKEHRGGEYERKKRCFRALGDLLLEVDESVDRVVAQITEIEDIITRYLSQSPPFIIIEIKGKNCDGAAPVLSNPTPPDGTVVDQAKPVISIRYDDGAQGSGIDTASVRLTLDGQDVTSRSAVMPTGVSYQPTANLADGEHAVSVKVSDKAHNEANSSWRFTVRTTALTVRITSQQNNQYVNTPAITVAGTVSDTGATVAVNGVAAQVSGNAFSAANVPLMEGPNTLIAEARDAAGHVGRDSLTITLDTVPPLMTISAPLANAYLSSSTIAVSGTLSEPATAVTVNGQSATLTKTGFSLERLPLAEGPNTIMVEAVDRAGNTGTASFSVTLDTSNPVIDVTSIAPDAYVNTPTITLAGTVTDPNLSGFWINDTAVVPSSGRFDISGFTLVQGENVISFKARDLAGNLTTTTVRVTLDTAAPLVTITTPLANTFVNRPRINITGTVSKPSTTVKINGFPAQVTGTDFLLADFALTEGPNTIMAVATDRAGNTGAASVYVTLDTVVPVVQITAPTTNTYINFSTITVMGTVSKPVGTLTVNGQGAVFTDTEFRLDELMLGEGQNIITVEARDRAGNVGMAAVNVNRDTIAPVWNLVSPFPDAYVNTPAITVSGTVTDPNLAGAWINDTALSLSSGYFNLTDFTLSLGENVIRLKARDLAGNVSATNVTVNLDATIPTVVITSPANGSLVNTPTIAVWGTVAEANATVSINGMPAQVTGTSFALPALILAEGPNIVMVTARDRAGNTSAAAASVTLDTTLPVIALTAPAEAAAGANISIDYQALDNRGLRLCELFIDGAPIWSYGANNESAAANTISYTLSSDLAAGAVVDLLARAYDVAGNLATANAQITVSGGPTGPGYLQGQVYDDTKGLLLEGATAVIHDGTGQKVTQMTTLDDGRYYYQTSAGSYVIVITKDGFTTVERPLMLRSLKNAAALDARLTPISPASHITAGSGGRISSGTGVDLVVPSGALAESADLRLTPISNQGLAGSLPRGWSPIGAVDIRMTGDAALLFAVPASLIVNTGAIISLAPASTVPLVRYDAASHQWTVHGFGTVSDNGLRIEAKLAATGQYALVLSDSGQTPPTLNSGEPLLSLTAAETTDNVSAVGKVIPPAAPAAIGLRAVGEVVLFPNSTPGGQQNDPRPSGGGGQGGRALSSGMIVNGRVTERFNLLSGDTVVPADYTQDIVLYQYPCVTNITAAATGSTLNDDLGATNTAKVGTSFPVAPSREFTIIDLLSGKVSVEVSLPSSAAKGVMVGPAGARIADGDGNVLVIPQGALTQTVPIEMKGADQSRLAGIAGSDFTFLRAVEINLTNQTFSQTAELSIPTPSTVDTGLPIVIAKLIDIRGAGKLKLVALANISGPLITSAPAGGTLAVPGLLTSGTYVFLQARSPLGFVKGSVKDASGNAYPTALVSADTCSLVDLSAADGSYLIASTVSAFTAKALDIYKYDEGTATGTLSAANETASRDLTIRMIFPAVSSVSFTDNGRGIEANTSITVTFSKALDRTTVTSDAIVLKDAAGNVVSGAFSINPIGNTLTFYPGTLLASKGTYTLTVSGNIRDLQSYALGQDLVKAFTVRSTTAPSMPPAGSITGTFPDAGGFVTIMATQGSADPQNTVLILNDNSGETVSVTPASNGSFTGRIRAVLGDMIKVLLMDNSRNQALVSYIALKSQDGRYFVTTKGGTVEGEGGTKLIIPEGALLGPATVKITPIAQADLPQALSQATRFLAAVNIDTGGVKFQKAVKLSVPAPANVTDIPAGSMPLVARPVELTNGDGMKEPVYELVDSAKVLDGRLTTASPPFAGILMDGYFCFMYPVFDAAIISGFTYREMNGTVGYQADSDLPVKRAVIRTPGAWNLVSFSDDAGHFAAMAEVIEDAGYPCRRWGLTAINPSTMYHQESNVQICDWPNNIVTKFNIKLGDQNSIPKDTAAPEISMNLTVVPGQTIPGLNTPPQFVGGTIPVGTDMEVPISIVDREMGTAMLTVEYKSNDGLMQTSYNVQLSQTGAEVRTPISADNPVAISKYDHQPVFSGPIRGSTSQYFRPDQTGTYTFTLEAKDAAGNRNTRSLSLRAIVPGAMPGPQDGPPTVDDLFPADQSAGIAVSGDVRVTFSEPIDGTTLISDSFKLIDTTTGTPVPAVIYTGLEGGKMTATLLPKANLAYGRAYEIVLTRSITDSNANTACNPPTPDPGCTANGYLPLDREIHTRFTTKTPAAYSLPGGSFEAAQGGDEIALYTHRESGRTFAYVTADEAGWRAVDVTDPTHPAVTYKESHSEYLAASPDTPTVAWRYRGAAVDEQAGILALTEWVTWYTEISNNFGYVSFYDIRTSPEKPVRVGREKLAENFSGVPHQLALSGGRAFVATTMVGIQAVNVAKAMDTHGPGKAIDGIFDSVGAGFGSPTDMAVLKGNLFVPTSTGHLLVLNAAGMPEVIGKLNPSADFRAWRVEVMGDYAYTDKDGRSRIMDLALISSGAGKLILVDVTDPAQPRVLSSLDNIYGTGMSISRTGMAYVTAGTAVDAVDIKDPLRPQLRNTIGAETYADSTSVSVGNAKSLVEQDGWAYLANEQDGMKVLDLEPKSPPKRVECTFCGNGEEETACKCKDTNQDKCKIESSAVSTLLREYHHDALDLTVKVPGASVAVQRVYYDSKWAWNHMKNNLIFNQTSDGAISSINKGGVLYKSTGGDAYTSGTFRITRTSGWKWEDTGGNWKSYDSAGKMIAYGTRVGTTANLAYGPDGKLISVSDRNNRTVVTYEYNTTGLLSGARDADNRQVEYTYNDKGLLTKIKDVLGNETIHEYDAANRLIRTFDAEGRVSIVNYDASGLADSVQDSQGKGTVYRYGYDSSMKANYTYTRSATGTEKKIWYDSEGDAIRVDLNGRTIKKILKDGQNLTVIDETGAMTRKEYDANDNLTRVVYPDGSSASYDYDYRYSKVIRETDEKGIVTAYEYDNMGNLLKKTEAQGTASERITTYIYDSDGNLLTTTTSGDANTQTATTAMTYDANGNVIALTDPEGNITRFTYDSRGNVLTRIDGRGKTWTYEYNAKSLLTQTSDPLGNTTRYFYDGVGNRIKEIDPLGKQKLYSYDNKNRLLSATDADGNVITYIYDADGRMLSHTDQDGKTTTYRYDNDGRPIQTTDGNGNMTITSYDQAGSASCPSCSGSPTARPSKTIFPTFIRQYAYDARGRKTRETDILSETENVSTQFVYDSAANLIAKVDKENRTTGYEYDELRRLKKATDALNQTTRYAYDSRDNLISLQDGKNQTTTFRYDRNNRLVKESRPLGQEATYRYNETGQLIQKTNAKNQKIEYNYDDAGRMTKIDYYNASGTKTKTVSLGYDNAGNLINYRDGTSTATYIYDDAYRKIGETISYGTFSLTTSYAYNRNGTKNNFTYPNGTTMEFTYDSNNQPAGINIPGVGLVAYSQYQWTRPTTMTLPGSTKSYAYDPLMRTKQIAAKDTSQNVLVNYNYIYDKMDNIKSRNTEAGNYAYGYDELYRLNDVQKDGVQTEAYTYDQVGNRLTSKEAANWTYNQNNELQGYNGATYQYDTNGNTIQKNENGQVQNYVYDVDNRLIEVRDASNALLATYTYDPFGRRIKKTVSPSGGGSGEVVFYLYSDEGLIGEYDQTGTEIKTYGYNPDSTWTTNPLFMKQNGNYYFYHNDHLGTPQKMTDASGAVMWSASYAAFGKAMVDVGSAVVNNLRFPGQYYDQETGWHYNWNRYYDPNTGRYITEDPIGLEGEDVNLFKYSDQNPLMIFDFTGLKWICKEFITLADGTKIAQEAKSWVGTAYSQNLRTIKINDKDKGGADCSGSTWQIYKTSGFLYSNGPLGSNIINENSTKGKLQIVSDSPQIGDIAKFSNHVAIYDPTIETQSYAKKRKVKNNLWTARGVGRDYSAGPIEWFGRPTFYRYCKKPCEEN